MIQFLWLSVAFGSHRVFGFELTFTDDLMISQNTGNLQKTTPQSIKKLREWREEVLRLCAGQGCKVKDKWSILKRWQSVQIEFQDGFWINLSFDPLVIEVTMNPGTKEYYQAHQNQINDFIFSAAQKIGLRVHERIGGGHLSYDYKTIFENKPQLLRNFLVDRANHPEHAFGIFGNHIGNAPPIAALKDKSVEAFYRVIREFDAQKDKSIDWLVRQIEKHVYTNNPYGWFPFFYKKFQDIRLTFMRRSQSINTRRLEERGRRPQTSFEHMMADIEIADKNLAYLEELKEPIKVNIPKTHKVHPVDQMQRLRDWLSARGLSISTYEPYFQHPIREYYGSGGVDRIDETEKGTTDVVKQYEPIIKIKEAMSPEEMQKFTASSQKIGSDGRALAPVPKLLSQEEHDMIDKGVRQRALMFSAFFDDIGMSGSNARIVRAGIIDPNVIKRLFTKAKFDSNEQYFRKYNNLGFYYAPDIIKDGSGQYQVIEDNLGSPGGMGDSYAARADLLKLIPDYRQYLNNNSISFAQSLVDFAKQNTTYENGVTVFVLNEETLDSNKYFIDQLLAAGAYVVTEKNNGTYQLRIEGDRAYLVNGKSKLIVGSMILRGFSNDGFKLLFPNSYRLATEDKLTVIGLPFKRYDIGGDKELLQYSDEMIKFYLNEEPILKAAKTYSFRKTDKNNNTIYNESLEKEFMSRRANYVIKDTQGLQGKTVWIGAFLSENEARNLMGTIRQNPGRYIAQRYIPTSHINGYITDIRVHTAVLGNNVVISENFWSRYLPVISNGKLNMSIDAGAMAVFKVGRDTVNIKKCSEVLSNTSPNDKKTTEERAL